MSLLDLIAPRKPDRDVRPQSPRVHAGDPTFSTKALRKFLACLNRREPPVLLDLGPVVGSNVSFFGDRLGCKIFVEDLFGDLDRHVRAGNLGAFPAFLEKRLKQTTGGVDGILCWDLFDYLDKRSAQVLATELTRLLGSDGALLAFFGTAPPGDARYTKFVIVDELNLRHRAYPASRVRQASVPNRDILRLFAGLRVSESFLLQNNQREILFRKPAPAGN
jgi:hypothetical protein